MTERKIHLFRKALGLTLFGFGLAWLTAETRGIMNGATAHSTHIVIAGVLMFTGGWLMNPPDAEGIADAIAKRLPLFWPGGLRKGDPPPQPGVPPPPSVAKHDDLTKPPTGGF